MRRMTTESSTVTKRDDDAAGKPQCGVQFVDRRAWPAVGKRAEGLAVWDELIDEAARDSRPGIGPRVPGPDAGIDKKAVAGVRSCLKPESVSDHRVSAPEKPRRNDQRLKACRTGR